MGLIGRPTFPPHLLFGDKGDSNSDTFKIFQAFRDFQVAKNENEGAVKEIRAAFKKLIDEARTVEELTEVWPDAPKILALPESTDIGKGKAVDMVKKALAGQGGGG